MGPDNASYAIVGDGVVRVDPTNGAVATVVQSGAGSGQGVGKPRLLSVGGPDLLIVDDGGNLWRWRPSDTLGGGTLGEIRVAGDQTWGPDIVDIATFVINPAEGTYRLYVPYPAGQQVLRYEPTADGSGFSAPGPYFLEQQRAGLDLQADLRRRRSVRRHRARLLKYFSGTQDELLARSRAGRQEPAPRPLLRADRRDGYKGSGQLFIWDSQWQRILVYDKVDGTYVEQYLAAAGAPPLSDLTGMYIIDRGVTQPPILVWARPDGLYQAPLERRHLRRRAALVPPGSLRSCRRPRLPPTLGSVYTFPPPRTRPRHHRADSRPSGRAEHRARCRARRPRPAPDRE